MLALACLTSAGALAWEKSSTYTSAPLLGGRPGTIETKTQPFADTSAMRLKGESWLQHKTWYELSDVATRLATKASFLNPVRPRSSVNNSSVLVDKRLFLASAAPDVLLVVPHRFEMERSPDRGAYWHAGSISIQLSEVLNQQMQKFGLRYGATTIPGANLSNLVELTNVFPDVDGIMVVSDLLNEGLLLAQAEADPRFGFRSEPMPGMPGYRRLVAKDGQRP